MSLHNLATVFGPTLLRPSEKESKLPANPNQPISMTDSWSLEVMSQVGGDKLQSMVLSFADVATACPTLGPASCSHSGYTRAVDLPRGLWPRRAGGSSLCTLLGFSGSTSPGGPSRAPRALVVRGSCHQQEASAP